ncbi:hypothetical protein AQJ11_03025 [Streptomyces corchorusii]|uniref:Uncharacterized protein n=2 Tax=Streptomyces TaxID=1883 RepID=A0A124HPK5_STRCK|nr:hypothetical protein [Streptomyces corchorusii]KUN32514.1 hypothetical protein AQJ11_03025 [Streptomyces corchorusii]
MSEIETRVCIDDTLGPYDARLDPGRRWNGFLMPRFTLDTVRRLSVRTLELADEYGYDSVETVHVIDGYSDSPSSVHFIEGGTDREGNPRGAVAHIRWPFLDEDPDRAVSFFTGRPGAQVKPVEPAAVGVRRTVVFTMSWQWWEEDRGAEGIADVYQPDDECRYGIGGGSWCWHFAGWWCACGRDNDWHVLKCPSCELPRDAQPAKTT